MNALIGKRINDIYLSPDNEVLAFRTDAGDVFYHCEGDCCSETWIHELNGVHNLLDATVADYRYIDMPTIVASRQEEDQLYGIQLVTDKGHALLAFRNSSNGYYGGSLEEGTNDGLVVDLSQWKHIADDEQVTP